MSKKAKEIVLDALDELALALASEGHKWTRTERRSYEEAVRLLS